MIFAHPFSDIAVTKALEKFWNNGLTKKQELAVWLTGMISTIFPDVDIAYALLQKENHRFLITHTFGPYLILALVALLITIVFKEQLEKTQNELLNPKFLRLLIPMMLIGVALHLFTDTLGAPVRLLYPLSNREFILQPISSFLHSSNLNMILQYYTTPLFLGIELFWITSGSLVLFSKLSSNIYIKRYLPKTLGVAVTLAAIMLTVVLLLK